MIDVKILGRLREKELERKYLLAQLDLWAAAEAQGLLPDDVLAFGFDSSLLTASQKRACFRTGCGEPYVERLRNGQLRARVFNYVRHCDGTKTVLSPLLSAIYKDF